MRKKTKLFEQLLSSPEEIVVKVGIFKQDEGFSREDKGKGPNMATIAYYNEYGKGVPERPAMRTAINKNLKVYSKVLIDDFKKAFNNSNLNNIGYGIGERASSDMKKSIKNWKTPKNAKSTIKKKGFNNPLVETGDYYKRIGYTADKSKTYKIGDSD